MSNESENLGIPHSTNKFSKSWPSLDPINYSSSRETVFTSRTYDVMSYVWTDEWRLTGTWPCKMQPIIKRYRNSIYLNTLNCHVLSYANFTGDYNIECNNVSGARAWRKICTGNCFDGATEKMRFMLAHMITYFGMIEQTV